jgi:hypothetical protein
MTRNSIRNAVIAAVALTMAPAAAQATTSGGASSYEREDDDFDWGWLGLLGLAGLLGLKKNDRNVHVDARRDTRP